MKAKTTSTALALPSFVPPARKEDIIAAMVERARVKHEAEREKLRLEKIELQKKAEESIIALFKESPHLFVQSVDYLSCSADVKFELSKLPPKVQAAVSAERNAPTLCSFDAAEVKRSIRAGMYAGGDRVKALLNDANAVKALDAALEAISGK